MYRFHIPDMTCGGCLNAVIRTIRTVDPTARVEGAPEKREVTVFSDKAEAAFLSALSEAGYPARPIAASVG